MMSLMVLILCCPFSHQMSWMRSGTELSQFLRLFPPTLCNLDQNLFFHSTKTLNINPHEKFGYNTVGSK